jgi:hypothetical protein
MIHLNHPHKWPSELRFAEEHLRSFLTGQRCMAITFSSQNGLIIDALGPQMKRLHWRFEDCELAEMPKLCERLKADVDGVQV